MFFGQKAVSINYLWYIEGVNGATLIDCGGSIEEFRRRISPNYEHIQTIEEGLNRFGIEPGDIKNVIITHLHWDHIWFASKFSQAKFYIQKAEYDYALNPHPSDSLGFDEGLFKNLHFELVEGNERIADGVRVILTPGHTPGGQSVMIDTCEGSAVITGFCCILDNFYPPEEVREKGFEIVTPGIHMNVPQIYDSVLQVKRVADIIIPLHEPKFLEVDRIP
jgi:glyoxylase-like metal-dependent hydrolase (beta-lactamase superfamily II)